MYEYIHKFEGWENIGDALMNAKSSKKDFLKEILKSIWFLKNSDYESYKYDEEFNLRNKTALKNNLENIVVNESERQVYQYCPQKGKLTFNLAKLHSASTNYKKKFRKMLKDEIPISDRYSKCLTKRKNDFVEKLVKTIQEIINKNSIYPNDFNHRHSVIHPNATPRIQVDPSNRMTKKRKLCIRDFVHAEMLSQQNYINYLQGPREIPTNNNYRFDNSLQNVEMNATKRFKMSPINDSNSLMHSPPNYFSQTNSGIMPVAFPNKPIYVPPLAHFNQDHFISQMEYPYYTGTGQFHSTQEYEHEREEELFQTPFW